MGSKEQDTGLFVQAGQDANFPESKPGIIGRLPNDGHRTQGIKPNLN
jgi:hypothetical protein